MREAILFLLNNGLDVSMNGELNIRVSESGFIVELHDPVNKEGKPFFEQWGDGPNGKHLERKNDSSDWREKVFDKAEQAADLFLTIKQELKYDNEFYGELR